MVRKFKFRNASFTMTFDAEGVADVITRNGKVISAAHRDAQPILRAADKIRAGILPAGYSWERSA